MKIGIPKERRPGEARVAGSPDMVRKLVALGIEVAVETGAGLGALMTDEALAEAGATIVPDLVGLYRDAEVVLKVRRPLTEAEGAIDEVAMMAEGTLLFGMLNPLADRDQLNEYAGHKITAFALELMPRRH